MSAPRRKAGIDPQALESLAAVLTAAVSGLNSWTEDISGRRLAVPREARRELVAVIALCRAGVELALGIEPPRQAPPAPGPGPTVR